MFNMSSKSNGFWFRDNDLFPLITFRVSQCDNPILILMTTVVETVPIFSMGHGAPLRMLASIWREILNITLHSWEYLGF